MIPFADPVVIALLVSLGHTADRVTIDEVGRVPSTRVAHVGDADATDWSRSPVYQVEVWAADALQAGNIATAIANDWAALRGRQEVASALVVGTWVESHPRALPDPESDHARYILEVGLTIVSPREV